MSMIASRDDGWASAAFRGSPTGLAAPVLVGLAI
jgi:hypothetical protein